MACLHDAQLPLEAGFSLSTEFIWLVKLLSRESKSSPLLPPDEEGGGFDLAGGGFDLAGGGALTGLG